MSDLNEIRTICRISRNESGESLRNPLIVLVAMAIVIFAFINGLGNFYFNESLYGVSYITHSLGSYYYIISILCTIVAAFVGVTSVAGKGDLSNVLLTKPVFKRDIILGKFFGNSSLMIAMIFSSYLISTLFGVLFYGTSGLSSDFFIRLASMIIILFIECSLVSGITMLFGILFRNLIQAAGVAVTFFYLDWYANPSTFVESLKWISPYFLYHFACGADVPIVDTTFLYLDWLKVAFPYIAVMICATILVVIVDCIMFAKQE